MNKILSLLLLFTFLDSGCSYKNSLQKVNTPNQVSSLPKFDWQFIKNNLKQQIQKAKSQDKIPFIDLESNYGAPPAYTHKNIDWLTNTLSVSNILNNNGITILAISPDLNTDYLDSLEGTGIPGWANANHILYKNTNMGFLPTPVSGNPNGRKNEGDSFRKTLFAETLRDNYPLLGEFFFRHYPSERQLKDPIYQEKSDINIPIDGPVGIAFFEFSSTHGIPFQIHYEVEDELLPPLMKMLDKYPKAKVIWCHVGRVRLPSKSTIYNHKFVEKLIKKHPNLYFDFAATDIEQKYSKSNGVFGSMLWDHKTGHLKKEWKKIFEKYPWRFLSALDLGSDRMNEKMITKYIKRQKVMLNEFSPDIAAIFSYRAAWKLVFNETI